MSFYTNIGIAEEIRKQVEIEKKKKRQKIIKYTYIAVISLLSSVIFFYAGLITYALITDDSKEVRLYEVDPDVYQYRYDDLMNNQDYTRRHTHYGYVPICVH